MIMDDAFTILSHSVQHLLQVMYQLEEKRVILEAIEQQYSSKESYFQWMSYFSIFWSL